MAWKEKTIHWGQMKSDLQRLFVRRVQEEMKKRDLSDNQLYQRYKKKALAGSQSSVSRLTGGREEPSMRRLEDVATALGVRPWYLLLEAGEARSSVATEAQENESNVPAMRHPYAPTFTSPSDASRKTQSGGKKPRRNRNR